MPYPYCAPGELPLSIAAAPRDASAGGAQSRLKTQILLIDEAGILRARGLVNSREHLESLFEAKRLGVSSLQEYFATLK